MIIKIKDYAGVVTGDYLAQIGIKRRSGRYPWGSGSTENKRSKEFLDYLKEMRAKGLTDSEIAKGIGELGDGDFTSTDLRRTISIVNNARKAADIAQATKLKEKGLSNVEIGKKMGRNESSIRSLLDQRQKEKNARLTGTVEMLRSNVEKKGFIDVGSGVEHHMGISRHQLEVGLAVLRDEGYAQHKVQIDQLGTNNKTTLIVLAPKGTTYKDIVTNKGAIKQITDYSEDNGKLFGSILPPIQVNSRKVDIAYREDGGAQLDGVIFVRPGKDELSLGKANYAQVRIAVDGTHYLKGMAMYKEDLPAGVDLVFNTNKSRSEVKNKLDAMKEQTNDPDSPFGAIVRQIKRKNPDGSETVTSAMNLVNEAGDWDRWSNNLSSQMLSKQKPTLAKEQLAKAVKKKQDELDEILSLTNPTVRDKLLETYSNSADAASVHLKAHALPRQATHVILPINSLKKHEVYAPNYRDGEKVVLVRHPHGGPFEIPELVVNNRNTAAKKLIGMATDAIGIHSEVADRLSGADFDGDTVLVIPNDHGKVNTAPALTKLKGFDPKLLYPQYEGMKLMDAREKGQQMGMVSNLITDMTIKGAGPDELARAVKHSMVVIDAEKHKLNWRQSAKDNGISQLYLKYQDKSQGGASTLISLAKSRIEVPTRSPRRAKEGGPVDKATGEKMWTPKNETYIDKKTGKLVVKTFTSKKLAETSDAHTLSSGTKVEEIYAEHSNAMKALANRARKEQLATVPIAKSPSAAKVYASEVHALNTKLRLAQSNRPNERAAQILAKVNIDAKKAASPEMDKAEEKKLKYLALEKARNRVDAKKVQIEITPREWEAIQAGAIAPSKLADILNNTDIERVKEMATPRQDRVMPSAKVARAKQMLAAGRTQAEVADALGVSLTTLKTKLGGG